MIARLWKGRTAEAVKDQYLEHLRRTGLKAYASTEGFRGAYVLRRDVGGEAEFLLVSLWDGYGAVHRFAGPDADQAVFYPDDEAYLSEADTHVEHFQVLVAPPTERKEQPARWPLVRW